MTTVDEMKNEALRHVHARHWITNHDAIDCWFEDQTYKFLRNSSPITEADARRVIEGVEPKADLHTVLDMLRTSLGIRTDEVERFVYSYLYNKPLSHALTVLKLTTSVDAALILVERHGYALESVRTKNGLVSVSLVRRGDPSNTSTFEAATLPLAITGAAVLMQPKETVG